MEGGLGEVENIDTKNATERTRFESTKNCLALSRQFVLFIQCQLLPLT